MANLKALVGIPAGAVVEFGGVPVTLIEPAIGKADADALFAGKFKTVGPQDGDQETTSDPTAPSGLCGVPGCDTCPADVRYAPAGAKLTADDFFAARGESRAQATATPDGGLASAAGGRFEGPLRAILVRRIKARTAASESDIQDALDHVAAQSDRPILDWLASGGLEAIIKAVLAVLKMFA